MEVEPLNEEDLEDGLSEQVLPKKNHEYMRERSVSFMLELTRRYLVFVYRKRGFWLQLLISGRCNYVASLTPVCVASEIMMLKGAYIIFGS